MGTWTVGAIVLIVVGLAGRKVYMDRKNGKGCGCGCDGCSACLGRQT
ncbi:MAG: FeoB-associated Cys-rich membrane protein [Oscillospiraceae bacterium]|nr:FeoB-associated Cys-rich membrane protein [Oscillospiraceae bacterium]